MPTYDYRCRHCQFEFDNFQSMTSEPLRTCPNCNLEMLERKIGPGGAFIFRGPGFYCNDYKKKKREKNEP